MLRITQTNHATLIDNRPAYLGMLNTTRNYISWGEASKETIQILLKKAARLIGNKKLGDEYAQKIGYKSVEELAEAIYGCKVEYTKLPSIKPLFRLHPPSKGFKGKTKKSYAMGGETGYRGDAINELLKRML